MKNILPVNFPSTPDTVQVENVEASLQEPPAEEIVLYDECGDTQWDKVLEQHGLAGQLNQNPNK